MRRGECLGAGTYGRVDAVTGDLHDGLGVRDMALKSGTALDPHMEWRLQHEARVQGLLSGCPNVVQMWAYQAPAESGGVHSLLLERCTCSLFDMVEKHGKEPGFKAQRQLLASVATALNYMEERGIKHGDLKGANILIGNGGIIKVGDLGGACLGSIGLEDPDSVVYTPTFASPEFMSSRTATVTHAGDWWALGVVMMEILQGHPMSLDAAERLRKHGFGVPAWLPPVTADFLRCLLHPDPAQRMTTLAAAKAHPFFAGFNWDTVGEPRKDWEEDWYLIPTAAAAPVSAQPQPLPAGLRVRCSPQPAHGLPATSHVSSPRTPCQGDKKAPHSPQARPVLCHPAWGSPVTQPPPCRLPLPQVVALPAPLAKPTLASQLPGSSAALPSRPIWRPSGAVPSRACQHMPSAVGCPAQRRSRPLPGPSAAVAGAPGCCGLRVPLARPSVRPKASKVPPAPAGLLAGRHPYLRRAGLLPAAVRVR